MSMFSVVGVSLRGAAGGNVARCVRQLSSSGCMNRIFHIKQKEDFVKEVLGAKKPVVVDFHAW